MTVLFGCAHAEVGVLGELSPYTDLNAPLCDPFDGVEREFLNDVIAPPTSESGNTTGVVVLEDGRGAIAARGWLTENAEKDDRYPILHLFDRPRWPNRLRFHSEGS